MFIAFLLSSLETVISCETETLILSNVSLRGCKSSNNINLEAKSSIFCKKREIINRNHAIAKYFHVGLISNFKKGVFDETVCGRSVGGVHGIRVAGYLGTVPEKSKALKEVVEGR
jgi:hypothetical protein